MLEALGIDRATEEIYLALVARITASAHQIASDCAAGVEQTRTALAALETQRLVSRTPDDPDCFVAAPPDWAVESLIRQHELELSRTRLEIKTLARLAVQQNGELSDAVELIHGSATIRMAVAKLQVSARESIDAFIKLPVVNSAQNTVENDHLDQSSVTYRGVYDQACLQVPEILQHLRDVSARGELCRVTRELPLKLFIIDSRTALVPLHSPDVLRSALLIHQSALLEALTTLFRLIWDQSASLHSVDTSGAGAPPPHITALLTLLAAGATDETIARQLGLGHRTAQRRARELLDLLGVSTRFQAGVEAARRGWL